MIAAGVYLLWATPHFVYHLITLDVYDTADALGSGIGLAVHGRAARWRSSWWRAGRHSRSSSSGSTDRPRVGSGPHARHRLPGWRGARRSGPDDAARARSDRVGRRDPVRPADPAGRARRRAGGRRAALRRQAAGRPSHTQEQINALLVELGRRRGATSVRLKGGDPFVFGRGGEEAQALAAAGIAFEVVPAVTAGVAAPAYAGHPGNPPRRRVGGRVHHRPRGSDEARERARLAGARRVPGDARASTWASRTCRGSPRSSSPAAARTASRSRSSSAAPCPASAPFAARSRTSPSAWRSAGIRPPAITLVGSVARLRDELEWLERRPLFGRSVVVTRARAQASGLAARLAGLGAEVVETPAIRIEPRTGDEIAAGRRADRRLRARGRNLAERRRAADGRRRARQGATPASLAGVTVAAIGPSTAARAAPPRHHAPTSFRRRRSPSRWSTRWRTSRSTGGACWSPARPRRATSSRMP